MYLNKNYAADSINNPVNKEYTKGISTAKGIGIFLVVLAHTCRDEQVMKMIYFFHMPLFFIISGILYNHKKYNTFRYFLQHNIKTLILPYTSFYILSFLNWFFIEKSLRPYNSQIPTIKPIIGFFYGTDYKDYMKVNGALWFLCALFIAKILLYFAAKYFKNNLSFFLILITSALVGYCMSVTNFYKLPFSINSSFAAFFFVGMGYLWRINYDKIAGATLKSKIISAFIFLFGIYLTISFNARTDMDSAHYGNIILFLLGGISGSYICILISANLSKLKPLEYFGNNSLILLGLSEPIKRATIGVFSKLFHIPIDTIRFSLSYSFVCTFLIFLIFIPIIYIFNNYLYVFIGKSKPGSFKENHFTPLQSVYQQSL